MKMYRVPLAALLGLAVAGLYGYTLERAGFGGWSWLIFLLPMGAGAGALFATGRATLLAVVVALFGMLMPAADGWATARAIGRVVELQQEAERAVRAHVAGSDLSVTPGAPAAACNQLVVLTEQNGGYVWYWYDGNQGKVTGQVTAERLVKFIRDGVPGIAEVVLASEQKLPERPEFRFTMDDRPYRGIAGLSDGCQFKLAWATLYLDGRSVSHYPKLPLRD